MGSPGISPGISISILLPPGNPRSRGIKDKMTLYPNDDIQFFNWHFFSQAIQGIGGNQAILMLSSSIVLSLG
jgi:hypothetical protein